MPLLAVIALSILACFLCRSLFHLLSRGTDPFNIHRHNTQLFYFAWRLDEFFENSQLEKPQSSVLILNQTKSHVKAPALDEMNTPGSFHI